MYRTLASSLMSLLFHLPEDLNRVVLNDWVLFVDLGKLDIAVSNRNTRKLLLNCFKTIRLSAFDNKCNNASFFKWINTRQLKLIGVFLFTDFSLSINGEHLEHLKCFGMKASTALNCLINSCKHLKSLSLEYLDNTHLLDLNILNQLEQFNLVYCKQVVSVLFEKIRDQCRNLVVLHVKRQRYDINDFPLEILRLNPRLRELQLSCAQRLLEAILTICPLIECISLFVPAVDLAAIQFLLPRLLYLREFGCGNDMHRLELENNTDGKSVAFLNFSVPFDDNEMISFMAVLPIMQRFKYVCLFYQVGTFPDEFFSPFERWGNSLTSMDLWSLSAWMVRIILVHLPAVTNLSVYTEEIEMLEIFNSNCSHLKSLSLTFRPNEIVLSFEQVMTFLKRLSAMEKLSLNLITDDLSVWQNRKCLPCVHFARTELCVEYDGIPLQLMYRYGVLQ